MNWAAAPARTTTSHKAACTMLPVVTTRTAEKIIVAAITAKKTFCAT